MNDYQEVTKVTREYYNSSDAIKFYFEIWGGEDIHIGIYEADDEPIFTASRRTVDKMLSLLPPLTPEHKVIDLGAGYGGPARYLAKTRGCHVTCLNISDKSNEINEEMNQKAGLSEKIDVLNASYEEIPFEAETFDIVWSEDAILHSGRRQTVVNEAYRVLKPGGHFIFTDPMQKPDVSPEALKDVYARIHLPSLASFEFYAEAAKKAGFSSQEILELSPHMTLHYARVKQELLKRRDEMTNLVSIEYIDKMLVGLDHWITAGDKGYLTYGIMHFVK